MIAIVDYGLGNICALANIYKQLNIDSRVISNPDELRAAKKIILPGVGSFDWAMNCLNRSGMRSVLDDMVLKEKIPVLGICVGMQMMASRSDEGELDGLGWIDAEVKKFSMPTAIQENYLPHMGWNDVHPSSHHGIFKAFGAVEQFYFLHSYYFVTHNQDVVHSVTNYGISFVSSVCSGNIFGVQFHPEKSHRAGIQLLKNFAEI